MDEQFKLLRSTKKTCDRKARQRGKLHVYSSKQRHEHGQLGLADLEKDIQLFTRR